MPVSTAIDTDALFPYQLPEVLSCPSIDIKIRQAN